jgi:ubiquitin carboxyl-terminal hydrolase 4/11
MADTSASLTRDPQSVVSRAAYLLFYRRRSDTPLGGPRFKEIFDKYDNHESNDEEESGEDQRLVGVSSQIGSSSAGTGVEATHQHLRGSARDMSITTVTARDDDEEELPAYSVVPLGHTSIQNSVEDEGVGMSYGNGQQPWSWQNLDKGSSRLVNYASDDAQHDSSGDEREALVPGELGHHPSANFPEPMESYLGAGATEDPEGPFSDFQEPPAPDFNTQIGLANIQHTIWDKKSHEKVISIGPGEDDNMSDKAAEIHLEEDDNTKLD